jgi:hypothetical protein
MTGEIKGLLDKISSAETLFLKILQLYDFNKSNKHLIFEGFDDQSFYLSHFIASIDDEKYISKGKRTSLGLYNLIDWKKYSKKRILFFIDRDYDRHFAIHIPTDVNIYESTFYSIENYVVTKELLERTIREIYHFNDSQEIPKILAKFDEALEKFQNLIDGVTVWVLLMRSKGVRPNLDQIDLGELFEVSNGLQISSKYTKRLGYLESATKSKTPHITLTEYREMLKLVQGACHYKEMLRGKFELWFFVEFLTQTKKYVKNLGVGKIYTDINLVNCMEILATRTVCPVRLTAFFQTVVTN